MSSENANVIAQIRDEIFSVKERLALKIKFYRFISATIDPLALGNYLEGKGWREFKIEEDNPRIKVYQYENKDDFFQVTIPLDKKLYDYSDALCRAVEIVAKAEGKPFLEDLIKL